MMLNFTNHPYSIWSEAQKEAAARYGEVIDMPFPQVSPSISTEDLRKMVEEYAAKIEATNADVVMAAGEFTFLFMLVDKLLDDGVNVVCSCSTRETVETQQPDGTNIKNSRFVFNSFRPYARYGK